MQSEKNGPIVIRGAVTSGLFPLTILIFFFAGCASGPPAVLRAADGESLWQRVETEHFVVESNLQNSGKVRRVASDFETLWRAFGSVPILGMRPPRGKPIIAVFQSSREYRFFAGDHSAGLFLGDTYLGPLIALPPNRGPFQDIVIKHELAHLVISKFLPNAPEWLQEGLAQVMETAKYDTGDGEILFGDFLPSRHYYAGLSLPSKSFMGTWPVKFKSIEVNKYYAKSWLLVHYLIDCHLKEFLDFEIKISEGKDWKIAWAEEFPLALSQVDDVLDRYHDRAKYGLWTVRTKLPHIDQFVESVVPPADVFALRSIFHAYSQNPDRDQSQKIQAANDDLEEAFERAPQNPRVLRIKTALEKATQ